MSRLVIFFLTIVVLGLTILLAFLGWVTKPSNLLGWFLFVTGVVYFIGVIIVYWIRKIQYWRPRANEVIVGEEQNDWSFWAIVLGMVAVFYAPPVEYLLLEPILPQDDWLQITGLLLVSCGAGLFIWARRTLGEYYSGHVSILEHQPLVQSGPYHIIRHPAYAGYLLIAWGLAVGYSSLAGFITILVLLLPSVIYRLSVEDKLLAKHFGEEFHAYAKKTARLVPHLW